ncbi:MAG TPA: EamA family transporter, partial [Chloroflexota bacterium]|nr:EamA family transporter [Chloroflexota bacterium]
MKNWAEKYGINTAVSPLTLGWIIAIASTVCFSVAPPIARGAILAGLAPTAVLVGRMAIALALLVIFIAVTSPGRFVIERRLGWIAFLSGIINGIGFIAFFVALTRLDASIASMLFSLSPLVVLGL